MKFTNTEFDLKDIVYLPVFTATGQPMFLSKEKDSLLQLKCFKTPAEASDFALKLANDKLIENENVLQTDNLNIETLLEFCSNLSKTQSKKIVVEYWWKEKNVDMGPYVLYNSTDLKN